MINQIFKNKISNSPNNESVSVFDYVYLSPFFPVDLFVMFKTVKDLGGYHQVIKYFQFTFLT